MWIMVDKNRRRSPRPVCYWRAKVNGNREGGGFEILGIFHNYKAEVSRVLMWLSVTGYVIVGGEKLSGGG